MIYELKDCRTGEKPIYDTTVEITEKDGENVTKSVVYLQSTQKTENLSVISYNTIPKTA